MAESGLCALPNELCSFQSSAGWCTDFSLSAIVAHRGIFLFYFIFFPPEDTPMWVALTLWLNGTRSLEPGTHHSAKGGTSVCITMVHPPRRDSTGWSHSPWSPQTVKVPSGQSPYLPALNICSTREINCTKNLKGVSLSGLEPCSYECEGCWSKSQSWQIVFTIGCLNKALKLQFSRDCLALLSQKMYVALDKSIC